MSVFLSRMRVRMLRPSALVLAASMLALTACSGAPDADAAKQALLYSESFRKGVNLTYNSRDNPEISETVLNAFTIELRSCAAASGAPGHVCEYRMVMRTSFGRTHEDPWRKARFYEENGTWRVEL